MSNKEKKLAHLEAVKRGRALGAVGEAAATVGEWMSWLWTTPGDFEATSRPPKDGPTDFTAPSNTRAAYETTYSRMTTPKSKERVLDPEELEWTPFYVETATP